MHNVNVSAVEQTAARAAADPGAVLQPVAIEGAWQTTPGAAQFRTEIPLPDGSTVTFEADFPPPMGGTGSAPNPLLLLLGRLAATRPTRRKPPARRRAAGAARTRRGDGRHAAGPGGQR